jgi:hypothetical protein
MSKKQSKHTKVVASKDYNIKYNLNNNELESCKWIKNQLNKSLVMENKEYEKKIKSMPAEHWKYSSILRHNTMKAMTFNLFMDTTNTIIVVFKIKDITFDDREVIYNISYINIKPSKPDIFFEKEIIKDQTSNLYINNVCPVGSTLSKDGEYRSVIIYWKFVQYILSKDNNLSKLYKEILDYFIDKFQDRKLMIYAHYYFPLDELRQKYSFELELMISNKKLELFSISWFMFFYSYTFSTISDRLNQMYQKIMSKYKHEDAEFFKSLISKYSLDTIRYMYHLFSTNIRSTTDRGLAPFYKTKLGQKLIPISLREIQYPFDITYKPWKEYFVNLRLSDLVVNNITPGFAITTNWLFIKNTDQHIFDNPSQYTRMQKSAYAINISNILSQARHLAYEQIKPSSILLYDNDSSFELKANKKNRQLLTSWLSKEFQILHDGIDDDIKHAQLNIIMSNVTFCMITEYAGKTLYESIFLTKKSSYYRELISNLFSEEGYPNFERFMFEIMYDLYCSASKFGIIHGDLHLHNITINELFYKKWMSIDVKNPKVLYVTEPGFEYLFDTNFYYMTIIDFSRCILNPTKVNMFKNSSLHKTFDMIDNMREFEELQTNNLISYLHTCKPEYRELGLPLQTGIKLYFNNYFKALSILDLFMIMSRLLDFLQMKNSEISTPYSGSVKLIRQIFSECDLYLTDTLTKLTGVESLTFLESFPNQEWPIMTIIKKVFEHRKLDSAAKLDDVVDIYNYNNELEYTLNDDAKLPDAFYELSKNKENDSFIKNSIQRKKIYEDQMISNYKTLQIIKKRQREKNIQK